MAALTSCGSCSEVDLVCPPSGPDVAGGDQGTSGRRLAQAALARAPAALRRAGPVVGARLDPGVCGRARPRPGGRAPRRGAGAAVADRRRGACRSVLVLRPRTRRPWARSRLVPRPEDRPARARLHLRVRHRLSRRPEGRHHQIRLGAVAAPPADRPRGRLFPHIRRALRGLRGGAAAVLVALQPVPLGRPLDERNRARRPAARLGLGAASAGRLAGGPGPVRRQPRVFAPAPSPSGVSRPTAQPRLLGEQPPDRRGSGPVRGLLRLSLFPGDRGLARPGRPHAPSRGAAADLRERSEPGAREQLSRVRARAAAGRGGRRRSRAMPARRRILAAHLRHDRCARCDPRRPRQAAAAGRRRSRPRSAARPPGRQSSARPCSLPAPPCSAPATGGRAGARSICGRCSGAGWRAA